MKIDFECNEDDVHALNRFFLKTPTGKKEMLINYAFYSIRIFFYALGISGLLHILLGGAMSIYSLQFALICAVVTFFINLLCRNENQKNYTKALLKRGNYEGMLGKQSVTLTRDGIEGTSTKGRYCAFWSSITVVHETPEHIYLQTSTVAYYLIPKRAFANAMHGAEFLRVLEQFRQQSTGESIPQTTRGAWWTQGQSVIEEPQSNHVGRN